MLKTTALILALLALPTWAHAELLLNGSFETGAFANPGDTNFVTFAPGFTGTLIFPGASILTGWSVALSPFEPSMPTGGVSAFVHSRPNLLGGSTVNAPSGSRFVDLNRGGDLWRLSQTFSPVVGQSYTLSYLAQVGGAVGGATTQVSLSGGSTLLFEDTAAVGVPEFWQEIQHIFVADSPTMTLSFAAKSIGQGSTNRNAA